MLQNTGLPDTLILNAGKGIHETLTEGDPDKWKSVLDLNIMGVLRCIRSFVPEMISQKQGKVIFMSSVAASKPYTYGAVYSASKAAVEMIAETLRLETLPHVAVTTINAGITDTGFFKSSQQSQEGALGIGMGSLSAQDIADDVWHIINKRAGALINKIITRPPEQAF